MGKEREEDEQGKGEGCGAEGTWKGLVNVYCINNKCLCVSRVVSEAPRLTLGYVE